MSEFFDEEDLDVDEHASAYAKKTVHPVTAEFAELYSFPLDEFQVRACKEIEEGRGVLLAAPTGSGKTIVGEFAVHLALETGRKCFYTTPIKALSNQKYNDLVARYGPDKVGLLTGDNVVNGEAPIVVMTTEVLRNMLYAGSRTLLGLGFVVMDEVHYLADRMRGAVWEEVIIHLPESVTLVSLSATVSNAEEFGEWLATVRGETTTIVEERRPVPLFQHVMVGSRLFDLFASSDVDASAGFVKEGAPVNDELVRIARDDWASSRLMRDRKSTRKGKPGSSKNPRQIGNGRRVWIPSRVEVLERLDREGLLPAIVFIFSRVGCDAAVTQCLSANVRLTDNAGARRDLRVRRGALPAPARRRPRGARLPRVPRRADARRGGPPRRDAADLQAVRRGAVPARAGEGGVRDRDPGARDQHAGPHRGDREAVEVERRDARRHHAGGVHPAHRPRRPSRARHRGPRRRAVAARHEPARGGRSRLDAHLSAAQLLPAVVQHGGQPGAPVRPRESRELLEQSFAQFQADRAVVGLARQLQKAQEALEGYAEAATCHVGDFMEYAALRRRISEVEKGAARERRTGRRDEAMESLARLKPGDVIMVPNGKFAGFAVVIDPGVGGHEPRPYVLTADRQARRLAPTDFSTPVEAITRMRLPKSFNGRNPAMRRDLASALRTKTHNLTPPPPRRAQARDAFVESPVDREIAELRTKLKQHPCHQCPEREDHSRWAERSFKLARDAETLKRRVESRTNTVARTFDRVCSVLTALDYLDGDKVTDRGRHLMRIYTDMDLVAAESLRDGLWDELTPSELAAVLSSLVYEARRADDASAPKVPGGRVQTALVETVRVWGSSMPWSVTTSWSSCASPTSGSPGRPTAGRRATTSTRCWAGRISPPVTSCAG